jgi:signal transduction histidine kinase
LLVQESGNVPQHLGRFANVAARNLPDDPVARQRALEESAAELALHLALFGPQGEPIATTAPEIRLEELPTRPDWLRTPVGWGIVAPLTDGRFFVMVPTDNPGRRKSQQFLIALFALVVVVGLGAYPLSRKLTRQLEVVTAGMTRLGGGDLSARVPVVGKDEVADLARGFNDAAERLERLVNAERRVIANASHELRSPLARIRLALELARDLPPGPDAGSDPRREVLDGATRDVLELDAMVEDLLMGARLGARGAERSAAPIDLRALIADLYAGPLDVEGDVHLRVDERAIRRAVRNLIDNANQHAGGDVHVRVSGTESAVTIEVSDRGPGVSDADRERVFEPFVGSGHGLGLSLVREVALAHGGAVDYRPRDGGGATFALTLPRAGTPT